MRTLLVVEDDEPVRRTLEQGLASAGYGVISVPTSTEALHKLEIQPAIDLAVIDIKMPHGHPHGFALGRMARLRKPRLPMVFMSGDPVLPELDEPPAGCRVLFKPVRLRELLDIVQSELLQRL